MLDNLLNHAIAYRSITALGSAVGGQHPGFFYAVFGLLLIGCAALSWRSTSNRPVNADQPWRSALGKGSVLISAAFGMIFLFVGARAYLREPNPTITREDRQPAGMWSIPDAGSSAPAHFKYPNIATESETFYRTSDYEGDVDRIADGIEAGRTLVIFGRARTHVSNNLATTDLLIRNPLLRVAGEEIAKDLESNAVWWIPSDGPLVPDRPENLVLFIPNNTDTELQGVVFEFSSASCGSEGDNTYYSVAFSQILPARSQAAIAMSIFLPADHPLRRATEVRVCGTIVTALVR